jgi:hypothetical protein
MEGIISQRNVKKERKTERMKECQNERNIKNAILSGRENEMQKN